MLLFAVLTILYGIHCFSNSEMNYDCVTLAFRDY